MNIKLSLGLLVLLPLAACKRPEPPPTDQPPEPQATALRDAIQQPLDKAKSVQQISDDQARKEREAIDQASQ